MKVSDFYNTEMIDYASYSTVRMLASAIDGQKNAARKVLKTVLDKSINTEIKVSQLGSKVAEYTEYLHGTIDGVMVTMAQNYAGTNNIPLLDREGNFGTRFSPEPSASRYIYTNGSKELFQLINKDDREILQKQFFEGHEIEPKFYLPVLPLLLVNGADGIATGFAQKILPRNPKKIKQYIADYLNNSLKPNTKNSLEPYYEGFTGSIEQGETSNQWLIKGVCKRTSITKVHISEIPVGYSLKDYIKVLDRLEDEKVITNYKDKSDGDTFNFEVSFLSSNLKKMNDEQLMTKLKLIKKVSENYTCINAENKVQVFENAKDILDYYINIKLQYLQKRKDYMVQKIEQDIRLDMSKYLFIQAIVTEKLIINKRKKAQIEQDLNSYENIIERDGSYDYLLNMAIHSLTEERMEKLKQEIENKKAELDKLNSSSINDIWLSEL